MTISEISEKYQVSIDTLRYYERIGAIPPVRRTPGGKRDFSEDDENWVQHVRCLRGSGVPMELVVRYTQLYQMGAATRGERREILAEARAGLVATIEKAQAELARLDNKIERYDRGEIE